MKWLLGIAAITLVMNNKAKDLVDRLSFRISGIAAKDIDWINSQISLKVKVINDNGIAIKLTGFDGSLSHGKQTLASIHANGAIHIPAHDSKQIKLEVLFNNEEVLKHIARLLDEGGLLEPFVFAGKAHTDMGSVPLRKTVGLLR